jgi:hypothetical protein
VAGDLVIDRPSAVELVQAVREFLERDVMAATEGRVQFHTRVAINALGMVAEHDLAARIRSGEFDDRLDEVRAEVRETVRQKLLVANPKYLPADEA